MLAYYLAALDTDEERSTMTELYHKNKRIMKATAMSVLHNDASSEDALHNAFVSIIENKKIINNLTEVEIRRLSVTIVRNKAIDILRKGVRIADTPIDEMYDIPSMEQSVEHQVEVRLDMEQLIRLVDELDEDSKSIVMLKYVHHLSYKEISEILGMPLRTIETRLYRARDGIKKQHAKEHSQYG